MGVSWVEALSANIDSNVESELLLPDVQLTLLNHEQKLVFNIVMKTLQDYIENREAYKPRRLIVGGTAGSGKSFVIKCLVKTIRQLFDSKKSVQVLCPTGNSANLISGVTLHSFLKIPVGKTHREMKPPDGQRGETLQANCSGLEVLLIDERSLIGATIMGWMEWMCRYGVNKGAQSNQSWGGIPVVVFFGDDIQLPPVLDSPVYNGHSKVPAAMHGVLVWKEFDTCIILKTAVRQQGEAQKYFRSVLTSLRQNETTPEQAKWLQKFQWDELIKSHSSELSQRMSNNGLFIFPTHQQEWEHNKSKLLELNKHFPVAKITAKFQGPHAQSLSDNHPIVASKRSFGVTLLSKGS